MNLFDQSKAPTTAAGAAPTNFFNAAAGDTGKTLPTLTGVQPQDKPGFGFGQGLTSTLSFGSNPSFNPGTQMANQPPMTQSTLPTFNAPTAAPNTTVPFGMSTSTPIGLGGSNIRMPGTTGFPSTTTSAAPTPGLNFGITKPATTGTGFTLGSTATSTTAPNLSFGATTMSTPAAGFNLGTTISSAAQPFGSVSTSSSSTNTPLSTGLTLGSTSTLGNLVAATSAPPASTQISLGSTAPSTTSSLTGFSFPGTTSAATGFNLSSATTTPSTGGFSLSKSTTAATPSTTQTTGSTQTSLGTSTTVTASSNSGQSGAINFCQLEELINKWTLELEEQEKVFMNQATQINSWDKLLIANGEKIVTLNDQVEKVKLEQQQLEHELDYVVGQQKELQDCLVPLEKELANVSVSDPEREYTYRLAEKLDTQLKQMSEDLKEIIEHLNEANRAQDSSDPIVQIGKILNAHMNSLQWIDQRTSILAQKIQQIDQMHQNFRQENERSFTLAYN
ncbi:nuclear pore glycoprotein p62 [Microplitis demolitor]|uniref:nuclear pore glycoprotein p62 n=1 Tax=Microplitis demolitor TaxID=69319 RepID=UPI0004CCB038|nr:nuclear pore glycoprotein p62 [Microplitis demolitor]